MSPYTRPIKNYLFKRANSGSRGPSLPEMSSMVIGNLEI